MSRFLGQAMNKVLSDPKLPDDPKQMVLRITDFLRSFATSINQAADGRLWLSTNVSTTYSSGENDHVILVTPAGIFTVTLPTAQVMKNKRVIVKRANNTTHTITIQSSAGNIDGAASVTLTTAYQSREFFSDGSNFWEIT